MTATSSASIVGGDALDVGGHIVNGGGMYVSTRHLGAIIS